MNGDQAMTADVRLIRVIWLALLTSIFMYGVVIYVTAGRTDQSQPIQAAFSNPIILVLHAMGAGMFILAFIVPSIVLRRLSANEHVRAPVAAAPSVSACPRVRVVLIMKWALIESAAVVGLMAAFIAIDPRLFLPLGGLAVLGMLITYPSDSVLQDLAMAR
jgi:hypothetical protein